MPMRRSLRRRPALAPGSAFKMTNANTRASAIARRAPNLPGRPVDMWTIGSADRLRFPRFPSELGKRGNARLRPHTHRHHSQQRI